MASGVSKRIDILHYQKFLQKENLNLRNKISPKNSFSSNVFELLASEKWIYAFFRAIFVLIIFFIYFFASSCYF